MATVPSIADQWRALNSQERNAALSRMTSEQKTKLAASLGYGEPKAPQPEARTFGNYASEIGRGVGRGVKDDVAGLYQTIRHPIDTATGLAAQGANAVNAAAKEYRDTSAAPMSQRVAAAELSFLENAPIVGGMVQHAERGGGKMFSPESLGAAAEGVTAFEAPSAVADIPIGKIARSGADIAAGTGPRVVDELVEKTRAENAAAKAKAAEKNEVIRSKRTEELNKHFEALQKAKGEEPTSLESGRPRSERELQSHKKALHRGTEKLNSEFQNDLKETAKRVKAQADEKYADVRNALGAKELPDGNVVPAPTVPSSELASAVKQAEGFLQGSSENLKVFKDILAKNPESDPDFVSYQGAKIPQGHPLYDVLKEQGAINGGEGATFADLQGYYSELGDKLASGKLAGDVYQATKSLHDSIGQMMQKMADDAGVGKRLTDAQQFYRGYMQTFRSHDSPIYKAIKEPEPSTTIKHFLGKDETGIQALAKYDPELAKRANTIRAYKQEAGSIRSHGTTAPKPLPELKPKTPEVEAEKKLIGPEDIRSAKAKALQKRAQWIQHRGLWVATWPVFEALRALWGDHVVEIPRMGMEALGTYAMVEGLARLMENPRVADLLTKPTARDLARITPEMARQMEPFVKMEQEAGMKVSPALLAVLSIHSQKSWTNQPAR